MDQEEIKEFIKEIRRKNDFTQEKFAEKYAVTCQTVSKWENGKSIPDTLLLRQMCIEYKKNFTDLLLENENKYKRNLNFVRIIIVGIIIVFMCLLFVFTGSDDDFQFKKLSTTCDNFNLYGSIAYNDNKTSIYISDISYCGDDLNKYREIECTLYEIDGDVKTKISSYDYKEEVTITLSEFLSDVKFNIEHYSRVCKMYQENAMTLEIKATDTNDQTIFYVIPLKLEKNCSE